ncbi:hypothetical protein [Marinimicrobium sp. ABcell2]|uniref:hypothetical protein n=1 Tax=Marinimicrobium sp. ABcell2 TaxID=3069751 RepID=UPI0027B86EF3|nr:hypothetical protein [Marinimicrobium sp. ABcell2]MDQ2076008.1 hypothetical protein [Marinimicrobium sp. ABcell2]
MKKGLYLLSISALTLTLTVSADEKPQGWLAEVEEAQRVERLQSYLGGFSSAMWEVGERFEQVHQALERENYPLAGYHWEKIRDAIQNGYMKRPGRQANSDALFLDAVWSDVDSAVASEDSERAWAGFTSAKDACMACHVAEDVSFMNNQPLFDLAAPRD